MVVGRIIGGDFVGGKMTVNHTEYQRSLRHEQVKVRMRMLFCDFSVTMKNIVFDISQGRSQPIDLKARAYKFMG